MFVAHYDLFKTSKNIREFIFHKIIKLIIKDSFKYLGHMGQKTNWSVILLVHTIHFFKKTAVTSASLNNTEHLFIDLC